MEGSLERALSHLASVAASSDEHSARADTLIGEHSKLVDESARSVDAQVSHISEREREKIYMSTQFEVFLCCCL